MKYEKRNKMNKIRTVVSVVLSFIAIVATAQHDSVIIIDQFNPTVNDATKLLLNPVIRDAQAPVPRISYSIEPRRLETPFRVEPIAPATIKGDSIGKLYRHHLKAGFGNYISPLLQYSFNSGRSSDLSYGLFAGHHSSAGKIKNYGYPGISDNQIHAYARKTTSKFVFGLDADYEYIRHHLYGFRADTVALVPDKKDYRQGFQDINLTGTMSLLTGMKSTWRYKLNVGYNRFSDRFKGSEQNPALKLRLDRSIKLPEIIEKPVFFAAIDADYYQNKYDLAGTHHAFLATINPGIAGNIGPLAVKLGVNAVMQSDTLSDFTFYPNVDVSLSVIPDILQLTALIKGGITRSTYKFLAEENPFISPLILTGFTTERVNFTGGLRAGFGRNVNINIAFNTSEYSNYPLFMPDTLVPLHNRFVAVYDNVRLVNIKADALYQHSQKLRIGFQANFYDFEADNQAESWYKPQFDTRLTAMYNLYNRIVLNLGFTVVGERMAPFYVRNITDTQWDLKYTTLKPFYDINLGVEYRYTKFLSGFLMLNNLTASRYQHWHNYPGHGFNLMLGLTYSL